MTRPIATVVIVGGGSAGWLTAGLVAAELARSGSCTRVVLVESPDVATIGVGEGTWPTMRISLSRMGISETDFFRRCDASYKQGTEFVDWISGQGEKYYHPFSPPKGFAEINLATHWQGLRDKVAFADAVCSQGQVCARSLGPKQIAQPEYASTLNYGYHLDAGKFATLLQEHCTQTLGVEHRLENVTTIVSDDSGDIAALNTQSGEPITGDLFVDCTGLRAKLIGEHFGVPFEDRSEVLFNDTALALQVPRDSENEAIASTTRSTAQAAGWIWDIALPTRRGVGYTFSSRHTDDSEAEGVLRRYLAATKGPDFAEQASPRTIRFKPGHRQHFWHRNCVAIGLSAGFVEPLEASALVMIELSAKMLGELMPPNRDVMDVVAKRFNQKFTNHWARIIEFLKLHYVLSQRSDSAYWRDHRDPATIPEHLQESLLLWRHHCPWHGDDGENDALFSTASYQYVLYGMGFVTGDSEPATEGVNAAKAVNKRAMTLFAENATDTRKLVAGLPPNRELLGKIHQYGLSRV